ncbi:MAG: hypothetical protein ING29_13020 [Azospirillum sp.]|nr:hypothetical protein [Azospirillum sp.]
MKREGGPRSDQDPTNVYVMQAEVGPIKIGTAKVVSDRWKQIDNANPFKIFVVHREPGDLSREMDLQSLLSAHHLKGEWYRDGEETRRIILQFFGKESLPFVQYKGFAARVVPTSAKVVRRMLADGTVKTYHYKRVSARDVD